MTSTVETLDNRQIQLTIEVEDQRLEATKRNVAKRLGKDMRIPGFRPGKAPYNMVIQQIGPAQLLEEAADELVAPLLDEAVKEHDLKVYSYQDIKVDIANIEPLTLTYQIPLVPEVTLGELSDVQVEAKEVTIDEGQVDKTIQDLLQSRAVWVPTLGPIQSGDLATLDLRGDLMDGSTVTDEKGVERLVVPRGEQTDEDEEEIDDADEESDDADVESDTDETDDTEEEAPVGPDINEQLVGMIVNQVKEFPLVYPTNWAEERLAGRTVLYRATLLDLKRRQSPELDDEFAQSVGEFDTVDELQGRIRDNIRRDGAVREFDRITGEILNQLAENSTIEFPNAMVQHEIDDRLSRLEDQLKMYGINLDAYYEATGKSRAEMEEEVRAEAEAAVRRSLVITEYARLQEIQVTNEELQMEVTMAMEDAGQNAAQLMQDIEKNRDAALSFYYNRVAGRKAVYALYSAVTGENVPEEVQAAFEVAEHDHDHEGHDHDHDHEGHDHEHQHDYDNAAEELEAVEEVAAEQESDDGQEDDISVSDEELAVEQMDTDDDTELVADETAEAKTDDEA